MWQLFIHKDSLVSCHQLHQVANKSWLQLPLQWQSCCFGNCTPEIVVSWKRGHVELWEHPRTLKCHKPRYVSLDISRLVKGRRRHCWWQSRWGMKMLDKVRCSAQFPLLRILVLICSCCPELSFKLCSSHLMCLQPLCEQWQCQFLHVKFKKNNYSSPHYCHY